MDPVFEHRVRIVITGGTFDKRYDPIRGSLGFGSSSVLPVMVEEARIEPRPIIEPLMLIDSLDMSDDDRRTIVSACQRSPERAIVIVHGTDTLVETARALAEAKLEACIVLTGAMVPACIEGSDARFNLGFAIGCVRLLPPGVYVAAHGRVFSWDGVQKNRSAARFEAR